MHSTKWIQIGLESLSRELKPIVTSVLAPSFVANIYSELIEQFRMKTYSWEQNQYHWMHIPTKVGLIEASNAQNFNNLLEVII